MFCHHYCDRNNEDWKESTTKELEMEEKNNNWKDLPVKDSIALIEKCVDREKYFKFWSAQDGDTDYRGYVLEVLLDGKHWRECASHPTRSWCL